MHLLWWLMARARGSSAILVGRTGYRYQPKASYSRPIFSMKALRENGRRMYSDQETDEATFAKQLAQELYRHAHSGDFAAVVLIADKQTLGQVRPILHKAVQDRLVFEMGKTLTKASITEIQKALS